MKSRIKQTAVKICFGRYGLEGYGDLVDKLNKGWLVKRVDGIYNNVGQQTRTIYILEKEIQDNDEQNA